MINRSIRANCNKPPIDCMRICVALAILQGCSTVQPQPVQVPLPARCIEQMPKRPALTPDQSLAQLADGPLILALREQHILLRAYAGELEAVAWPCAR